jgi:ribonuclease P protein component
MLAKQHRLKKGEDFIKAFSKGGHMSSDGIALKYARTTESVARIGFSVGKQFSKKAVDRNRLRRVLRSAASKHMESLKPGFDIIIMPLKSLKETKSFNTGQAEKILGRLFSRADLLM